MTRLLPRFFHRRDRSKKSSHLCCQPSQNTICVKRQEIIIVRVNGAMAGEFPTYAGATSGGQEVMASGKETERSSHAGRQSSENFQNSY